MSNRVSFSKPKPPKTFKPKGKKIGKINVNGPLPIISDNKSVKPSSPLKKYAKRNSVPTKSIQDRLKKFESKANNDGNRQRQSVIVKRKPIKKVIPIQPSISEQQQSVSISEGSEHNGHNSTDTMIIHTHESFALNENEIESLEAKKYVASMMYNNKLNGNSNHKNIPKSIQAARMMMKGPPNKKPPKKHFSMSESISIPNIMDDVKDEPPMIIDNNDTNKKHNIQGIKAGHNREYSILKSRPKKLFKGLSEWKKSKFAKKTDTRKIEYYGGCHCGNIKFEILCDIKEIQYCYCNICRKIHGSELATYAPVNEHDIRIQNHNKLNNYESSKIVKRYFCGKCSANIYMRYKHNNGIIWISPNLIENSKYFYNNLNKNEFRILHIFCDSKSEWHQFNDDHPKIFNENGVQILNEQPTYIWSNAKNKLPPKPPRKI